MKPIQVSGDKMLDVRPMNRMPVRNKPATTELLVSSSKIHQLVNFFPLFAVNHLLSSTCKLTTGQWRHQSARRLIIKKFTSASILMCS
jgi:hypothetical protein